jgi:hypothetical protein
MAKVNAPLFAFGASGKLADTLVFFPWKGLNVVRRWVSPANPKTAAQTTIRGYLSAAVDAIQAAQIAGSNPLGDDDVAGYRVLAGRYANPMTWWNAICKGWIDQNVASKEGAVYRGVAITPGDGELAIELYSDDIDTGKIETGNFWYGTTPSTLLLSQAATPALGSNKMSATISGLTNGVPYYVQFVPATGADYVGANSGIYKDTPAA